MYNAVIISKLLYGLESLELIDSLKTRLNAFQIRGLRHILKIEHAYWSRTSNDEIIATANMLISKSTQELEWNEFIVCRDTKNMKIQMISDMLEDWKIRLLGLIMRSSSEDPLYKVTFNDEGKRLQYDKKRVGRPRNHWTEFAMSRAYEHIYAEDYDANDELQRLMLFSAALEKLF